jgi:hypothetical protein
MAFDCGHTQDWSGIEALTPEDRGNASFLISALDHCGDARCQLACMCKHDGAGWRRFYRLSVVRILDVERLV